MDDRYGRPPRRDEPGRGAANAMERQPASRPAARSDNRDNSNRGNGLLGRYADGDAAPAPQRQSGGKPNGLLSRARQQEQSRGAWAQFKDQAQRFADNIRSTVAGQRTPQAGEWKASDFSEQELDAWDRRDAAPFELPPDPDAPHNRRGYDREPDMRERRPSARIGDGRRSLDDRMGWDDDESNTGWDSGVWDTRWATNFQSSVTYAGGDDEDDPRLWTPGRGPRLDDRGSGPLATLAMIATPNAALSRRARLRILRDRRPGAAALVIIFLISLFVSILAPLIPIARLSYDIADATYHVNQLQNMVAGGPSALLNTTKLAEARDHVKAIQRDLYEIDGAVGAVTAPINSLSPTVRNYRLLIRMGYDLTTAASTGIDVAETLLRPLTGGALSSDGQGITPDDLQKAREALASAEAQVYDAVAAYQRLDTGALPSQLQPGSKYGKLLSLLTLAPNAFTEMKSLLDAAPALLGVGAPANYLIISLDRSELRPGGGFQGNYGFLTLEGGKQSKANPLSLHDIYDLDIKYFHSPDVNPAYKYPEKGLDCNAYGPRPPDYYWWWPYQNLGDCKFNWGLRDANLSPDFPTNARTAIQTVSYVKDEVPNTGPIQGVLAFTPIMIEDIISVTGDITVPVFNRTVTPNNLESTLHEIQANGQNLPGFERKEFLHQLSILLMDRLKHLDKSKLKDIVNILQQAIKQKDLQIYLTDPRAELILEQLGLSASVSRGSADGFLVNDANIAANKANTYVTQRQTDVVTLLPNGGALHRLQIATTYDKTGNVFHGDSLIADYMAIERAYLPGDAIVLGVSGYTPKTFYPGGCDSGGFSLPISDCSPAHAIKGTVMNSDVPGRTMVMGGLLVMCGPFTSYDQFQPRQEVAVCDSPKAVKHTQNVYITWYTPHAFNRDASGHGAYSLLVEKQPGTTVYVNGQTSSTVNATVYVDSSQLSAKQAAPDGSTPDVAILGDTAQERDAAFAHLLQQAGLQKAFDGPLSNDTTVTVGF